MGEREGCPRQKGLSLRSTLERSLEQVRNSQTLFENIATNTSAHLDPELRSEVDGPRREMSPSASARESQSSKKSTKASGARTNAAKSTGQPSFSYLTSICSPCPRIADITAALDQRPAKTPAAAMNSKLAARLQVPRIKLTLGVKDVEIIDTLEIDSEEEEEEEDIDEVQRSKLKAIERGGRRVRVDDSDLSMEDGEMGSDEAEEDEKWEGDDANENAGLTQDQSSSVPQTQVVANAVAAKTSKKYQTQFARAVSKIQKPCLEITHHSYHPRLRLGPMKKTKTSG